MHEFRQFIQEQMDIKRWSPSELSRRSGLSTQHVSKLLADDRDSLADMPRSSTVAALSRAFGVPEATVLLHAARAYGIPVDSPAQAIATVGDEELLYELRARLRERQAAVRRVPMLDINAMAHQSLPQLVDLMEGLRGQAAESEARGNTDLALTQRFLADQIKAAFDAAEAANRARAAQRA